MNKKLLLSCAMGISVATGTGWADNVPALEPPLQLSDTHMMQKIRTAARYLLLPVQENEENARVNVVVDNHVKQTFNIRLAGDKVDYYVPLDLSTINNEAALLDIVFNANRRTHGHVRDFTCWKHLKYSETFDTANREKWRPLYHHTPPYGWMNDPNGMFYKDGVYHLYFQFNPYGSQWENMTWGHSTSKDLLHWTFEGEALVPDALGTIFSGSCVVDMDNTAGFGKGAIVAFYTSAGTSQTQSMAYSIDNGRTFKKYSGNPIITANIPDFRDPHVFWHTETGRWVMILAAGQEMQIYTSADLKAWMYESSFGKGYGCHDGVWECPDLMQLSVRGTNRKKWVLICNINPGGPFGGNATQYFTGQFDGHRFTCEDSGETVKWMDCGKDHYAAVTFDNAPDSRRILMTWMSNWQYANQVPTLQYRSANAIPCDLDLYEHEGKTYVGRRPSKELIALRGKPVLKTASTISKQFDAGKGAYEAVLDLRAVKSGKTYLTLQNSKGENVKMAYDADTKLFSVDRTQSGETEFSDQFKAVTVAPVRGSLSEVRIFVDKSSVEVVDDEGRVSLTNLVFPNEPYNKVSLRTAKGSKAYITIYELKP